MNGAYKMKKLSTIINLVLIIIISGTTSVLMGNCSTFQLTSESEIEKDKDLLTTPDANLARCLRLMTEVDQASIGKLACNELIHTVAVDKDFELYDKIWDKCILIKEERQRKDCFTHFDKLRSH
jgi:hypothetical protein